MIHVNDFNVLEFELVVVKASSHLHKLLEDTMRYLLKVAVAAVLAAAAAPAFAQSAIQIEKPWTRATPAGATTGAVYMTISNKSGAADRLTGASSDVADKHQIHEMKLVHGVMRMREVPGGLRVPANGTVVLKPGSYHVMLIGLKNPLKAGDNFPLTLVFEKAGNVAISVPVRAMGAKHESMPGMSHMDMK